MWNTALITLNILGAAAFFGYLNFPEVFTPATVVTIPAKAEEPRIAQTVRKHVAVQSPKPSVQPREEQFKSGSASDPRIIEIATDANLRPETVAEIIGIAKRRNLDGRTATEIVQTAAMFKLEDGARAVEAYEAFKEGQRSLERNVVDYPHQYYANPPPYYRGPTPSNCSESQIPSASLPGGGGGQWVCR